MVYQEIECQDEKVKFDISGSDNKGKDSIDNKDNINLKEDNGKASPFSLDLHNYSRLELLDRLQKELDKVTTILGQKDKHKAVQKHNSVPSCIPKLDKYESNQILREPSQQIKSGIEGSKSGREAFTVRHFSVSQDMRPKPEVDVPRMINSKELADEYLQHNQSRLYSRGKSRARGGRLRGQSVGRERQEFMGQVGSLFKGLKRENKSFLQ